MVEEKAYELFITERESLVLEALVKSDVPFSQRAQALLAVDAGSTLEQASLVSGLRVTQVKYWLARFDSGRLGIFPESVLEAIETGLQSENLPTTGKASAGQAAGKSKKSKKKEEERFEKEKGQGRGEQRPVSKKKYGEKRQKSKKERQRG